MGNCIKHPQIHEDVYPTPTGSAEPPRFDAKSVETHATHVELHNEEGELNTSFPSEDDNTQGNKRIMIGKSRFDDYICFPWFCPSYSGEKEVKKLFIFDLSESARSTESKESKNDSKESTEE
jgi:hypothetical protein